MGLKRRHKKKKLQQFDPNRVVKLDHKHKCYVVDEAPRFPLIATPRQLQKRFHYYSESDESESEELSSDAESNTEYVVSSSTEAKDLICMSSSSTASGFEGGGTAPANPKKMLSKRAYKIIKIKIKTKHTDRSTQIRCNI